MLDNKKSPVSAGTPTRQTKGELQKFPLIYYNIPEELRNYKNWLVHKKKVPYSPVTFKRGNSVEVCGTLLQAIEALKTGKFDGLGFHFDNTPFTGVDIDKHIENGKISKYASNIINKLSSYTEYSPSKTGVHIIVIGELKNSLKNSKKGLEMYSSGRYFTFTCESLNNTPKQINERQEELEEIYEANKLDQGASAVKIDPAKYKKIWDEKQDERDEEAERIVNLATKYDCTGKFNALFYEGNTELYNGDSSSADIALMLILCYWCKCDPLLMHAAFNKSRLAKRKKWQEGNANNPMYYRTLTINKAIAIYKASKEEQKNKLILKAYEGMW